MKVKSCQTAPVTHHCDVAFKFLLQFQLSNHQFEKIARQPLNRFKQCSNFSYIYHGILTARVKGLFDLKDVVVFLR